MTCPIQGKAREKLGVWVQTWRQNYRKGKLSLITEVSQGMFLSGCTKPPMN